MDEDKVKVEKLKLNKTEIEKLSNIEADSYVGGIPGVDIPTVGWDDGSWCLSKTDWGWCWCYGS